MASGEVGRVRADLLADGNPSGVAVCASGLETRGSGVLGRGRRGDKEPNWGEGASLGSVAAPACTAFASGEPDRVLAASRAYSATSAAGVAKKSVSEWSCC